MSLVKEGYTLPESLDTEAWGQEVKVTVGDCLYKIVIYFKTCLSFVKTKIHSHYSSGNPAGGTIPKDVHKLSARSSWPSNANFSSVMCSEVVIIKDFI